MHDDFMHDSVSFTYHLIVCFAGNRIEEVRANSKIITNYWSLLDLLRRLKFTACLPVVCLWHTRPQMLRIHNLDSFVHHAVLGGTSTRSLLYSSFATASFRLIVGATLGTICRNLAIETFILDVNRRRACILYSVTLFILLML